MSDEETPSEISGRRPGAARARAAPSRLRAAAVAVAVPRGGGTARGPDGPGRATRGVEQRKARFWLPLLIPVGAIAVVAFFTLNISRVFLAASEADPQPRGRASRSASRSCILVGATVIAALPRDPHLVARARHGRASRSSCCSPARWCSAPACPSPRRRPASSSRRARRSTRSRSTRSRSSSSRPSRFDGPGRDQPDQVHRQGRDAHARLRRERGPRLRARGARRARRRRRSISSEGDYVIYCTIPGHRAAGMEADLDRRARAGDPTPEPGTETPTETTVPAGGTPSDTVPGSGADDPASQSSTGGTGG